MQVIAVGRFWPLPPLLLSSLAWTVLLYSAFTSTDSTDPLRFTACRNNRHVVGKWKFDGSIRKKTYYVCSYDDNDFAHNKTLCGTSAHILDPQQHSFAVGSSKFLAQVGGHAAYCDIAEKTRQTVSIREQFVWEPFLCHLVPWDAELFCLYLRGRKILFLGDSTNAQTAGALMSRITWDFQLLGRNDSCANQISVARLNRFQEVDATKYITAAKPNIIILNSGAHFQSMSHFRAEFEAIRSLQKHTTQLQEDESHQIPQSIVWVWKTLNPGHLNCDKSGHLNSEWAFNKVPDDRYNWYLFPRMDELAMKTLSTPEYKNMTIINMSPLYHRQDAHPATYKKGFIFADCLHYCLPGPIDLFGVLLLNMLLNHEL